MSCSSRITIASWADSCRSAKFRKSTTDQITIGLYQDFLNGNITAEECARRLAAIYEPLIIRDPRNLPLAHLWEVLCDAVRNLGEVSGVKERLVNLVIAISLLPEVIDKDGQAVVHDWDGSYWRVLPDFAQIFRQYGVDIDRDAENCYDWYSQATPFLNATVFAAMYLNTGADFMGHFASGWLTEALSQQYMTQEEQYQARMYIRPAAAWILTAGERLFDLCQSHQSSLSLEYWLTWKQKFAEIGANAGIEEDVRHVSRTAATEMIRIENLGTALQCNT